MNEQRVCTLIAAYGADSARWPEEERAAAAALVDATPALRTVMKEAQAVDAWLDGEPVSATLTLERILENLPMPGLGERIQWWVQRLLSWLTPTTLTDLWRPALAAAAPLALGITIGVNTLVKESDWSETEAYVFAPSQVEVGYE